MPRGSVPLSSDLPSHPLPGPRYWLHDRADGPRRATVAVTGTDGSAFAVRLDEHAKSATDTATTAERTQPLGARAEAAFAVDGASAADLVAGLERLAGFASARASRNIEAVAREWFRTSPPNPTHPLAVALVARSADELAEQVAFAAQHLQSSPQRPLPADPRPAIRDRVFVAPKPLGPGAKVALVFPGSGNQFDGMGRDLAPHWPEVLRRQHAENERLRSQFAPELFWDGKADGAPHRDLMFGQVTVGSLVADVVGSLGVPCDAMVGLSLGESAGLFAVRAWRGRDEMWRRMQKSSLFVSDLAPPYDAARAAWRRPAGEPVDWVSGVLAAGPRDVRAALRPGRRAYLLIVNTPGECVIGGRRADVEKLAAAVGGAFFPLSGVTLAHCEAGKPVEVAYRELHTLPVTPPAP
jgi:acyl transferase domain-containing protein